MQKINFKGKNIPQGGESSPWSARHSSREGQSLVEAMVAITALTVSFLGISSLLARSFVLNRTTTSELTATYLASEGIEVAKNLIDHDVHAPGTGWGACFGNGGNFELDYATINCSPPSLSTFTNRQLDYHVDTNLYDYNEIGAGGGTPTGFTREISVRNPTGYEIQVDSIVSWPSSGGGMQSTTLEDDFYNW